MEIYILYLVNNYICLPSCKYLKQIYLNGVRLCPVSSHFMKLGHKCMVRILVYECYINIIIILKFLAKCLAGFYSSVTATYYNYFYWHVYLLINLSNDLIIKHYYLLLSIILRQFIISQLISTNNFLRYSLQLSNIIR